MKVFLDNMPLQEVEDFLFENVTDVKETIKELRSLANEIVSIKEVELYVSKSTMDSLITKAEEIWLQDQPTTCYLMKRALSNLFKSANVEQAENLCDRSATYFLLQWTDEELKCLPIEISALTLAAEYKLKYFEHVLIYCFIKSKYHPKEHISILKENKDPNYKAESVHLDLVISIEDLKKWLDKSKIGRHFKATRKHGLNGVGNQKGQAVLLSKNEEEAQEHLNNAIASEKGNDLYYFDKAKNKYLVFKDENFFFKVNGEVKKKYHGYHIEEKDINSQIPLDIQNKIKK